MSDPRLELLVPTQRRLVRIADDVHDGDPIEANHLLKVDKALAVAVRVVERGREVGPVRVGLEERAPLAAGVGVRRDVEEDRVGSRFEDSVGLRKALRMSSSGKNEGRTWFSSRMFGGKRARVKSLPFSETLSPIARVAS